jgi:hypothetical protein
MKGVANLGVAIPCGKMERAVGVKPTVSTLARLRFIAQPHPQTFEEL